VVKNCKQCALSRERKLHFGEKMTLTIGRWMPIRMMRTIK
jgi:hypothetical protein